MFRLLCQACAFQLIDYVSANGLGDVIQSAYKLDDATKTAVLSIKNDANHSLARGNATALVLLDQSAAFGRIDHGTLLDCLRSFCLHTSGLCSWSNLVPLIYYSPQQNHPSISFHFCIDDTQLHVYILHKKIAHAFHRLKSSLDDVKKWLSGNKLKLNADKTELSDLSFIYNTM